MVARQISDGGTGGNTFGQSSTDLISFYGATPVVKTSVTCVATGCVVATVLAKLNTLINQLKTYGLV